MWHIKRSCLFYQNQTAPFPVLYPGHEDRLGVLTAPCRV